MGSVRLYVTEDEIYRYFSSCSDTFCPRSKDCGNKIVLNTTSENGVVILCGLDPLGREEQTTLFAEDSIEGGGEHGHA